jgi:hypothetical protein
MWSTASPVKADQQLVKKLKTSVYLPSSQNAKTPGKTSFGNQVVPAYPRSEHRPEERPDLKILPE